MTQIDRDALKRLASKYVWWKTPDEAVDMPGRVIAQVMNIGDYADVQLAHQVVSASTELTGSADFH